MMNRTCGDCTLCCKLVPVKELSKGANTKCEHQYIKGCRIYANRPISCKQWSCAWLTDPATEKLRRPDRAHYVMDTSPDFIETVRDGQPTGDKIPVLQIWVDPKHPDAHKDQHLRAMLDEKKVIAMIRYASDVAYVLFPPSRSTNGKWNFVASLLRERREHTAKEIYEVCGEV